MDSYTLQKRIVLSFETKTYEDGDTDYTYIMDICTNAAKSLYSLTLSTGIVRIVNAENFENVSTINTGRNTLFCSYFVPFDQNCIVIADHEGFICVYDFTTGEQKIQFQIAKEIYSAALLCGGKMILAGDKEHIYFSELETGKQIGMYRDVHSDVINNLCSHPTYPTVFASGSEDGLINVFDVARGNQEDSIISIFQTDSGVSNIGWCGPNKELIWCTSMTRGLSLWNSTTGDRLTNITDYYMLYCNNNIEIDFLVGCIEDKTTNQLVVLGGNQEGDGYIMSVEHPNQMVAIWKGHQSAIRCFIENEDSIITCGEDASLCVWNTKGNEHKGTITREKRRHINVKKGKDSYKSI